MKLFELWHLPINIYCKNIGGQATSLKKQCENLKVELKKCFPDVLSDELSRCSKIKGEFQVKKGLMPVFKPKRSVPFAALDQVDKELDRLEKISVIEKIDHSKRAAPAMYVKEKNNKICVCDDFLAGLNKFLESHNYPLPSSDKNFSNLNYGKIFSKLDVSKVYL